MISFGVVSFVGDVILLNASIYYSCKEKVGNSLDSDDKDRSNFG